MEDWKSLYCAAITVGKHNQMLHTGFFDQFSPAIRDVEIADSKHIIEEVFTEYPELRGWMAI